MVRVTQIEIAKHLGVSTKKVQEYLHKEGIKQPYDLDKIRIHYIHDLQAKAGGRYTEGDLDPQQERARKDKEMADKYARENAVASGQLVSAKEVEEFVAGSNHRAKVRLLKLPRALAVVVPREVSKEVEKESEILVREALEELTDRNAIP